MSTPTPNVKALFDRALEMATAEREAYLDAECAGAPDIRQEVEDLLRAHAAAGSFLEPRVLAVGDATGTFTPSLPGSASPTTQEYRPVDATRTSAHVDSNATSALGDAPSRPAAPDREGLGTVIAGRYTLVDVIGEGGMGSVYRASQTEPVKRQVAVKLIKAGMDSKAVLARFDAERQALALMDHPNIARIYDGGVTEQGQPYFVMELVRGVPLTEYCDAHRLPVDARLQLFVAVCQAVQHAHQKGIIHRDLKPGNVLVTEVDGKPTPKVIDFGVAKATEQKLTEMSFSDMGAIVGTPAYMSPEQADPTSMDIDTRTDVYALGVMLYELLTGSPPIDSKQFKRGAILEMLRMVREVEPPRPSTKLSTADALPNIAANRSIEPVKLSKLLQGELDWVVMKALEKDRTRRYETANGLARDLQRYLADEVVEARPPTRGYRLKKFVKRNKVQVAAVGAVAAALMIGIVGFAWQANVASRQRDLAVDAQNAETAQRLRAEEQERLAIEQRDRAVNAEKAEKARGEELKKVSDFQSAMLNDIDVTLAGRRLNEDVLRQFEEAVTDSGLSREQQAILREQFRKGWAMVSLTDTSRRFIRDTIFNPSIAAIDKQFADQPQVDALLRQTVSTLYIVHSLLEEALPNQLRALETRKRELGEGHPDTIHSLGQLSMLYHFQGQHELALTHTKREVELAETHLPPDAVRTADAYNHHALALQSQPRARHAEAEKYLRGALDIRRKVQGEYHDETMIAASNLAAWMAGQGNTDAALAMMSKVVRDTAEHVSRHNRVQVDIRRNYARMLLDNGKLDEVEPILNQALQFAADLFGIDHRSTIFVKQVLADFELARGNLKVAEEVTRDLVATCLRVFVVESSYSLGNRQRLMTILLRQGRVDEAEAVALEIQRLSQGVRGIPPWEKLWYSFGLVNVRIAQQKYAEALQTLGSIEADYRRTYSNPLGIAQARLELALGRARLGLAKTDMDYAAVETSLLKAGSGLSVRPNPYFEDKRLCLTALIKLDATWRAVPPNRSHFDQARGLALIAKLGAAPKSGVTAEDVGAFADRSVAALAEAIKAGGAQLDKLKGSDFDALRDRADFKQLVAELEVKSAKPPEKK